MVIEIPNKVIYSALAVMVMIAIGFHVYKVWNFANKEEIFNSIIKIGDETGVVVGLLGRPSFCDEEFPWWEPGAAKKESPTKSVIVMSYRGYPRRRADLTLIFDRTTYRLIEKSRAGFYRIKDY